MNVREANLFYQVKRLPGPPTLTSTSGVMGGRLCIDGTRVPPESVLAYINGNETDETIYDDFGRIPYGSIELVIDWARENGLSVTVPDRRMPVARAG